MWSQLVQMAVEITRRRRKLLEEMREAVRLGDREGVFELARQITGLGDEERNRVDPRVH